MTQFSDLDLIRALQSGDKSALYQLYDRYAAAIYGVILKMCKDKEQAQDLLQDTFVKIWQQIHQYDPEKGRFYTWSYRIARNTTLNSFRNPLPLIQTEDLSVYKEKTDLPAEDSYNDLRGVLKALEPHHQRALQLVYFKGYTHKEAHGIMEVPLGTFKSYIRQGIRELRKRYNLEIITLILFFAFS